MLSVLAGLVCLATPAPLDVESKSELELRVRGEYAVVTPPKPVRFKSAGPGRMIAYVLPKVRADGAEPSVDLEVWSGGASVFKEHVVAGRAPGLVSQPKSDFLPGGIKRVSFDLLPKAHVYEFRVNSPAAISVSRVIQAPPGIRVPEAPVRPEGRVKTFAFVSPERWHWASVCDHVLVSVPGTGVLQIAARTQVGPGSEVPPPTFLRAISDGKVQGAFPITSAPEPGLEFSTGGSRFAAGTLRTLSLPVPAPADYELGLAAWGCVNGVGLQIEFLPGATSTGPAMAQEDGAVGVGNAPMVMGAQLAQLDGGTAGPELGQCGVAVEEVSRRRALEYLDTMVASGIIPASEVRLRAASELGGSFVVQSVWYALDGNVVFQKQSAPGTGDLAARRVVPGPHTVEVRVTVRGQGTGTFNYLNEYVIKMSKKESFVADSGKKYALKVTLFDRGGFTTSFKDRPALKVDFGPEG